jgi:hypothetical protein
VVVIASKLIDIIDARRILRGILPAVCPRCGGGWYCCTPSMVRPGAA